MKDTIYLTCSNKKVEKMTKSMPSISRGEIVAKLHVTIDDNNFTAPTIEKHIEIVAWHDGTPIGDVDFHEATITEEEADIIRQKRKEDMANHLRALGYEVKEPQQE